MKFDPQIPIGKAIGGPQDVGDAEVAGHGLVFENGEPATSASSEQSVTGEDDSLEGESGQRVPENALPTTGIRPCENAEPA